jgi:hypothetical protein
MIACPRCGWLADVPRDRESAVWAEHQRDPFCAQVEPVHAPRVSAYRARLCIKGHRRDAFGVCWECQSTKQRRRSARALAIAIARGGDEPTRIDADLWRMTDDVHGYGTREQERLLSRPDTGDTG